MLRIFCISANGIVLANHFYYNVTYNAVKLTLVALECPLFKKSLPA